MNNEVLTIGGTEARPGTMTRGAIPVGADVAATAREIPILICRGASDGPILWINGATHGDEPEGALSIFKLFATLDAAEMRGTVVGVPAMNVPAFEAGKRGDPLDTFSYDMNRIYPGRAGGYPTERAAWAHWQAMKDACDLQIAVHSGGEHSYLAHMIFASDNPPSFELAAAMGPQWDLVFRSGVGGANPSSKIAELASRDHQKWATAAPSVRLPRPSPTTWRGKLRNVPAPLRDDRGAMRAMPPSGGCAPAGAAGLARWMWVGEPDVPFETPIPAGTPLGRVFDLYGDECATVVAPEEGVVFGLRSRPAVIEGEWCCFYGVIDEVRDDLLG